MDCFDIKMTTISSSKFNQISYE